MLLALGAGDHAAATTLRRRFRAATAARDRLYHSTNRLAAFPCCAHRRDVASSRLIQPDRIQPDDVVNAEIFVRVVALDIIVPDHAPAWRVAARPATPTALFQHRPGYSRRVIDRKTGWPGIELFFQGSVIRLTNTIAGRRYVSLAYTLGRRRVICR